MKILLSAFAFAPGVGSEAGGAWHWALELARRHQVVVVTDATRRPLVQPHAAALSERGVRVLYFRPRWLAALPLNSRTAHVLFALWQLALLPFVRRLQAAERFDLVHHISYGVFRQASWLGFVGVPFVFGPLGGGEDAPWRIKRSLPWREKLREAARSLANAWARVNPLLRWATARAALVVVRTEETRTCLAPAQRQRALVAQEIGCPEAAPGAAPLWDGGRLRLLFVGRLLGWKGAHFALRTTRLLLDQGADVELTLVGRGPAGRWIAALAERLALGDRLQRVDHLPQRELFALYRQAHLLLFPSLHDSGGNVVLEALSAGLPVVCLNLGGPPMLVDEHCARVVQACDCSEEQLVQRLAQAVRDAAADPESWRRLSAAALRRAAELSWERQVARIEPALLAAARCRA